MSRFLRTIALLLAAVWLPASVHCQLEGLALADFLACPDQAAEAPHEDKGDCTDDGCQTVETGQIVLTKSRLEFTLLLTVICACHSCDFSADLPDPIPEISAARQDEALPLQRTWHFARRAALPARAPDALNV